MIGFDDKHFAGIGIMDLKDKSNVEVLGELACTINARRTEDAASSYTASLLHKGVEACAKKFGEEAVELALASVSGDGKHVQAEAADVLYHLLVLLEASDVSLNDVLAELARRQGTSGHVEKAARAKGKGG
ncbi:MAG: phosphoribosyl-ATP diphosphatase [Hyphomicrobiales bacterium]